jgi:hypothetical protein
MSSRRGWFSRHWHGELSLAASFWVNNVLLAFPAGLAIGALMAWITVTGDLLKSGSLAVLVGYPLLLLFSIWCIVGCWRSARAYLHDGGSALWGRLTQLLLVLGAINTAYSAAFEFAPNIGSYVRMARGIDPLGNLSATLSADGTRLKLEGPIGAGDGQRVGALVRDAKALRVIELDSPGGRLKEAETLAAVVRSKGPQVPHTRTTGACESACTLIHMAGSRRQVQPGAKLGFHSAYTGTWNPVLDRLANRELARLYREAGLPEPFVQRTLETPPWRMWYPSRAELAGADLLHVPERPLDIELPPAAGAAAAEYEVQMQTSDTWLALDKRQPGVMALAARRMAQARSGGAGDDEVQVQAQQVIEVLLPQLLAGAAPQQHEAYLALLLEQLASAQQGGGPEACIAVLRADAAARRALPRAVVQREADWLIEVAGAGEARARAALSPIEEEVLRRRLGDKAPAQLARAWRVGQPDPAPRQLESECKRTIELLRTVAALPAAERRLAARVIFERS